jgi:hypothetical protein
MNSAWRRFVPLGAIVLAGVAALLLRWAPPGSLQFSAWLTLPPTPIPLALAADRLNLAFAWLLLAWLAADELDRLVHGGDPSLHSGQGFGRLLGAAAGLAFLLAANLPTLCLAWIGLDAVLWLAQRPTPVPLRWIGLNLGAVLAAVAAAALAGYQPGLATWSAGDFPDAARGFLALAAAVRAGAFPFHPALPFGQSQANAVPESQGAGMETCPTDRPWALRMVPLVSGLYLLLRAEALGHVPMAPGNEWMFLGGLGLLATALLGLADREVEASQAGKPAPRQAGKPAPRCVSLLWIGLHPVSLILLLAGVDDPLAAVAALLVAVNLPLSVGLLALTEKLPESSELSGSSGTVRRVRWAWQAMRWLAVGSLLGVPPTLGFAARWAAYRVLLETGAGAWLVVVTLATIPLAATLILDFRFSILDLHSSNPQSEIRNPKSASFLLFGPGLLTVPLLILGLQPLLLGSPVSAVAGGAARLALAGTLRTTPVGVGLWIVVALLVPLAAGYGLIQPGVQRRIVASRLPSPLAAGLALDWAYDLVGRAAQRVGAALTVVLAPLRGERYVSWTLLLAVILALVLIGQ